MVTGTVLPGMKEALEIVTRYLCIHICLYVYMYICILFVDV
jgi:hypothetical protein